MGAPATDTPRLGPGTMRRGIADLSGKTAVITGGANGIGRELAAQLAAHGVHLALVDIDGEGLKRANTELQNRVRVSIHEVDVADRNAMQALAPRVAGIHDAVDLLVNSAGIAHEGAFPQTTLEAWDRVLGVNLWGVIHSCHFFMPYLAKAPRAHIVNLSSLFGYVGMPGQSAYCTSKYAVRGFSECLWEELRPTSVGLTVVHPGSVATDIMRAADGDDRELLDYLAAWYDENGYPPAKAAKRIIRAVRRGTPRLLIAREAYLADLVKRAAPVRGNRALSDFVIRFLGLEHMREKRSSQWEDTMVRDDPEG